MSKKSWLAVGIAALTIAGIGPGRADMLPSAPHEEGQTLRHELGSLREAYLGWAESAVHGGPEALQSAPRRTGLDYEYHRLRAELGRLQAESPRDGAGARQSEIDALSSRMRGLTAALQAARAERIQDGKSTRDRSRRAVAQEAMKTASRPAAARIHREAVAPRTRVSPRVEAAAGFDPASHELALLRRAEQVLLRLERQSPAELCRRGWERRFRATSGAEVPGTNQRDRLDALKRLVPRSQRDLVRMRDPMRAEGPDAWVVTAADRLLSELRPYAEALRGCKTSEGRFCSTWVPPATGSGPSAPSPEGNPRPLGPPPANDSCTGATAIGNGTYAGDTTDATADGESSCGYSGTSPDVWYRYTAPASGAILFSTLGSSFDTVLSIHSGCPGNAANQIDCNDDWTGLQSQLSIDVTAGQEYLVRIAGFGDAAGAYQLSVGPAGSISGTVTADQHWFVSVAIYDSTGNWVTDEWVGETPAYAVPDLPAGDYFALTWNHGPYIDELYAEPDNVPCPFGDCVPTSGTPIPVSLGSDTSGIDFALEVGGMIGGSLTDTADGSDLESAWVEIYDLAGNYLTEDFVQDGRYAAGGLPSGSYVALSGNHDGYLNEIYDDLLCLNPWTCDVTVGMPISVSAPATTLGIDFALAKGGAISGHLVDQVTGSPVHGYVEIYDAAGEHVRDAWPDWRSGPDYYRTEAGLATGLYFARSVNWNGFADEIYDDLPCLGDCVVTSGAPIAVTVGSETGGIDFLLKKTGGAFGGRVTDGVTGLPIPDVSIEVYDSGGGYVSDGYTDADGYYLTSGSLSAGPYYAVARGQDGYHDELWQEIDCSGGCVPTSGTPIAVSSYVLGIDFTLEKSGAITGQVSDAVTAAPLEGVWVGIYDTGGAWVCDGYTDADGKYISPGSLAPGTYFATTYNDLGYFDELYNERDCSGGCTPTDGDPIVVASYATGVDFTLPKAGGISGTVADAATGLPLEDVDLSIYKQEPGGWSWSSRATTDAAGAYASERPLDTGFYYVRTENRDGYIDERYDNQYCLGWCDLTASTPIAVTAGVMTSGIDFALDQGATVSGQITDAATGAPINNAMVRLYGMDRDYLGDAWGDWAGRYRSDKGLPGGSYFAISDNWEGYINEIYDGTVCAGCEFASVLGGTPIALSAPHESRGIDFALTRGARITGNVFEAGTLDPLGGPGQGWCPWVEIYAGNHLWITNAHPRSESNGWYQTESGLPPGTYYAVAQGWCGYATEAWDSLACPWSDCDLPETTPIVVSSAANVSGVNFFLDGQGWIAGTVSDDAGPPNPLEAEVHVFDASGRAVLGDPGYSDPSTGAYSTPDDLCAGDYYLRTVNFDGLVDEAYNNLPCAGCDPTLGSPVTVAGGPVTGIDFALSAGGAISGEITNALDGTPMAWVEVLFVNAATGWAATIGETDGSGLYTSYGALPSGDYYVTTYNEFGYLDELYDGASGVPCSGPLQFNWRRTCPLAAGLPVAVTSPATTPDIDFVLDPGGGIAGTVSSALTGAPIPTEVWIYDAAGTFIEEVWAHSGDYSSLTGLPAGDYYAHTRNWEGYPDECYQDQPCPGGICDPTLGTPITVAAGNITQGVDLALGSFSCDPLPSAVTVTGWIDHPAIFLACNEVTVRDLGAGPNSVLELVSGGTVVLDGQISILDGASLIVRNQQ